MLPLVALMRYDECMRNRDILLGNEKYDSPYPSQAELKHKNCDICGLDIVVNNWPDRKSRTPKFKDFVVCTECDPRYIDDRLLGIQLPVKVNRRRMRILNLARVVRALAKHGCLLHGDDWEKPGCKCAGCAAIKLFS
jgi:hypothetical protein